MPITSLLRFRREGIALFQAVTQLKLPHDVIPETPFPKIAQPHSLTLWMGMENLHEIVSGILVEDEHTLTVALGLLLLIGVLLLHHLDSIFAGNVFECLIVGELLMLHHEMDG